MMDKINTDYQIKVLTKLQSRIILWQQDLKKMTGIENVHKICFQLKRKGIIRDIRIGKRVYWTIA